MSDNAPPSNATNATGIATSNAATAPSTTMRS